MDNYNLHFNYLRHWITEGAKGHIIKGRTIKERIQQLIDILPVPTDTITVYRGQEARSPKIFPGSWFSTSSDIEKVLRQHIQKGTNCCLFKIHVLPGIKRFAVNDIVKLNRAKGFDESEIIVNGNGVFYKDPTLEEEGFDEIGLTKGVRTFETWYSFPREKPVKENININNIIARNAAARRSASATNVPKKFIDTDTLFDRISPDQYQYITNKKDFRSFEYLLQNEETTDEILEEVLRRIREKTETGGSRKGKKTRKARRKTRKSKR